MAKHDTDPVLKQLVQAINESGRVAVPVTVSVHGTLLNGALIAERSYFSELVEGSPLMSAGGEDDRGPFARLLGTP
jgi:hypothetical protein